MIDPCHTRVYCEIRQFYLLDNVGIFFYVLFVGLLVEVENLVKPFSPQSLFCVLYLWLSSLGWLVAVVVCFCRFVDGRLCWFVCWFVVFSVVAFVTFDVVVVRCVAVCRFFL
jgi:hypothetical protein